MFKDDILEDTACSISREPGVEIGQDCQETIRHVIT